MKTRSIERRLVLLALSMFMALMLLPDIGVRVHADVGDFIPESDCLTFTAKQNGSSVTMNIKQGLLQYSKNNAAWKDYTAGTAITLNNGQSVRFRGNNVTFDYDNHVVITGKVACSGNIMSLRLDDEGKDQGLSDRCFEYMFKDCTGLTLAPELPTTTLAKYCYSYMFDGCTGLTTAPELPATTLAYGCYAKMFRDCIGLTTAPELTATTLAECCYQSMFANCTSLTSAPELPAITLAFRCYESMFSGCSGLTTAPELSATTLAGCCYVGMFYDCSGLTSAPELPATTLAASCYNGMFIGCTGLTSAPELPATTLADSCYEFMFDGCTGLTSAPELPATTLADYCYYYMFRGCTGICISETRTDEYNYEYRVPSSGTGTIAEDALYAMFSNTGGTFTGTPEINKTYYMKRPVVFQTTLNMKDYTGIYVYIHIPEGEDASQYTVETTPNNTVLTTPGPQNVALTKLETKKRTIKGQKVDCYQIDVMHAASIEMTDTVVVTLKKNGKVVKSETYSVASVAGEKLADSSLDAASKKLLGALLQYGRYAQIQFKHNDNEETMPAIYPEAPALAAIPNGYAASGDPTNFSAYIKEFDAKLDCKDSVAINVYLTPASGHTLSEFEITILDKDGNIYKRHTKPVMKNGKIYIKIKGIYSNKMDNDFRIVVKLKSNPNVSATWTRSVIMCAYASYQKGVTGNTTSLKNVTMALYQYFLASKELFKNQ